MKDMLRVGCCPQQVLVTEETVFDPHTWYHQALNPVMQALGSLVLENNFEVGKVVPVDTEVPFHGHGRVTSKHTTLTHMHISDG